MSKKSVYSVVYFDDSIVVLNKQSGILTAPDRYDQNITRLDVEAQKEFGELFPVHRIDKETSGLVIYARNAQIHRALSLAFENREVDKTYHALIYGKPEWVQISATHNLLVDADNKHKTIAAKNGKESQTDFLLLGSCSLYSWICAKPLTGRTHQIRAHLAALGLSIVCDPLYAKIQKPVLLSELKRSWRGDSFEEKPLLNRLGLHAYQLSLSHPKTAQKMTFTAPYQKDMEAVRNQLEKWCDVCITNNVQI